MKIYNRKIKIDSIVKSFFLLIFVLTFTQNSKAQELKLKYFGGAGWEMIEGDLNILVDPYISRLKLGDSPSNSKEDTRKNYYPSDIYVSDTATINKVLTNKVDYILVHHSHLDHLADVPYIAKKTGAIVIATETSCKILKAYGIPEKQLLRVRGGEDYQFDKFSVRVIPSIHSALDDKHYYDSRMHNEEVKLPLKLEDFIEGKSLMFLIRFKNHKVLTAGSMNFLEREVAGLKPDIILPGVNFSRLEIYKYTERLMQLTNFPKIVIPTHWDNFRVPYGFSQESAIDKKIKPFLKEVKLSSPKSKVIVPVHLETIIIK